jgi:RNA polymerase sigma-70 factor (ECF subfamily)
MNEGISSEDLMKKVAGGDQDAFEALVNRHQASVLNLIYRFIGDRTVAKDLAQEVFLRVWQTADRYEARAKFTTWIYKVTANLCLNELKSRRRRRWLPFHRSHEDGKKSIEETFPDGSPTAEDVLITRERNREISEVLQGLPANQRMAIVLKRYDDLSYNEIAQILGCSVSSVESLIVRAKSTLQRKLKILEK